MTKNRFAARTAGQARKLYIFCVCLLPVLVLAIGSTPACAASDDFVIYIAEPGAVTDRDIIFEARAAGEGDVFSHNIVVKNEDKNAYEISLLRIDAIKDSILTDRISFSLKNAAGKTLNFTKHNFGKALKAAGTNLVLYRSAAGTSGGFALQTSVGPLANEYQGTSCKVRFTFRIVRTGKGPAGKSDKANEAPSPQRYGGGDAPSSATASQQYGDDEAQIGESAPQQESGEVEAPPSAPDEYVPENPGGIPGGEAPLAQREGVEHWSLLSLLMSAVAVLISLMYAAGIYMRHRRIKMENERLEEELSDEAARPRGGAWKAFAIAAGALTPSIWLLLDDLRDPVAFINANTKWVAVIFAVHLILSAIYQVRSKRKTTEEA